MSEHICTVTSKLTGVTFGVRVVFPGERYGREDSVVNNAMGMSLLSTLVEFYDATQDPRKFGTRGQFVSRYYLRDLLIGGPGLDLNCGVKPWKLCAESRAAAVKAAALAADAWWNSKYPPRNT